MHEQIVKIARSLTVRLSQIAAQQCSLNPALLAKAIDTIVKTLDASPHEPVFIIVNGACASFADHAACDLLKAAGILAFAPTGPALLTAYANDYSYDLALTLWINHMCEHFDGGVLIALSSSGNSANIVTAAEHARQHLNFRDVITISGFEQQNRLQKVGTINFWVDTTKFCDEAEQDQTLQAEPLPKKLLYNPTESVQNAWLFAIVDGVIQVTGNSRT